MASDRLNYWLTLIPRELTRAAENRRMTRKVMAPRKRMKRLARANRKQGARLGRRSK